MKAHPEFRCARIRRFKALSVLKLISVFCLSGFVPLGIYCGVAAAFGGDTVKMGSTPLTGVQGLVGGLVLFPLFGLFVGLVAWPFSYLAFRVFGRSKPFAIEFLEEESEPNQTLHGTPAEAPPSSTEPEGRRP